MKQILPLFGIMLACVLVFLLTLSGAPPKVIEVPGPTVEVPVETIVHEPADNARIESLEARLKACEAERDAALQGWRDAYAAWEKCSRVKSAPLVPSGGGQGSPSGFLRRRAR